MELISNKLYFYLESAWKESYFETHGDTVTVNLDSIYKHHSVRKHFGPPTLKVIWRHCDEVDLRIKKNNKVIILTNDQNDNVHIEQRTLSAFLMAAYAVLRLSWKAEKANEELLMNVPARLAFFRDYHGDSTYKLNILDCLRGLRTGCQINHWFTSYTSTVFPRATNSHLDMNWIIPNMFIAFKDPTINRNKEYRTVSKAVLKELKRCGIKIIVRLNSNDHVANFDYYGMSYHVKDIKQEDFVHFDIPFRDVGIPTMIQAKQFVRLCERFKGKIAVHCHAGLGRTATMIGCHLIKNYGFDARSVCAWLKMCRRGSVMGPQHFFLNKYEVEIRNIEKANDSTKALSVKRVEIPVEKTVMKVHTPDTFIQNGSCKSADSNIDNKPPDSQTKIVRPPRKNNIIHITPVSARLPNKPNPMQKYKREVKCDNKQDVSKSKIITPQSGLFVKSKPALPSSKTQKEIKNVKIHPSTPINRATVTTPTKTLDGPNHKKPRKQGSASAVTHRSTTKPNILHLSNAMLVQEKKRVCRTAIPRNYPPMNKKISKSHDAILSKTKHDVTSHFTGNNTMMDGLISHSKSKIYSLISNVYSKKSITNPHLE